MVSSSSLVVCQLTAFIGITGGFAPPTPSAIHTITLAESNLATAPSAEHRTLQIASSIRPDGTIDLQDALPKELHYMPGSDEESTINELHGILKSLPTESPPGSEDIYGSDTSIAWFSDDLEWCNGGPQGCGGGQSVVNASEEHKAKFKRAVSIINDLVTKAK